MLKNQQNRMIRLPRIGKIKIGKKDEQDLPKGLDYFIIDSDYSAKVFEVYHRKDETDKTKKLPPNIIRIAFPSNDIEVNLDEMYRWYGTSGLKCTGDGETFNRFVDVKDPEEGCPCHLAVPPEGQKQQCYISMRMSFIILGIGVTGVWQFSSKSVYSMSSVRAAMKMVKDTTGRLAGMPFYMRVEMQKSALADNPHVFPVVSVDCAMDIEELMAQNLKLLPTANKQIEEKKDPTTKEIPASAKKQKSDEKTKFTPLIQHQWDEFDKYLNDNKAKLPEKAYNTAREWLDGIKKPTVEKLILNLSKIKTQESKDEVPSDGYYKSYHESLITACCDTLKTKDRLPVIQTLNILVRKWGIDGQEKLKDCTENECLNLLDEFDKAQVAEQEADLPY